VGGCGRYGEYECVEKGRGEGRGVIGGGGGGWSGESRRGFSHYTLYLK